VQQQETQRGSHPSSAESSNLLRYFSFVVGLYPLAGKQANLASIVLMVMSVDPLQQEKWWQDTMPHCTPRNANPANTQ
jgi:hypothetical protein